MSATGTVLLLFIVVVVFLLVVIAVVVLSLLNFALTPKRPETIHQIGFVCVDCKQLFLDRGSPQNAAPMKVVATAQCRQGGKLNKTGSIWVSRGATSATSKPIVGSFYRC